MHYPDPVTGQPAAEPAFVFQYTIDGLVAARSDARGMRFEHVYDELGRRIETHVDDAAWFVAPQCEQPDNRAVNRVSRLAYQYRPDGLLTGVTAFTRSAAYAEVADLPECTAEPPPGDEYVLADHLFDYDGFGNLTREVQSHGAPAAQDSPAISYEWDFAGASAGNP